MFVIRMRRGRFSESIIWIHHANTKQAHISDLVTEDMSQGCTHNQRVSARMEVLASSKQVRPLIAEGMWKHQQVSLHHGTFVKWSRRLWD